MNGQTAVVIGGTGLVGSNLVRELLQDINFEKILVLTRRPLQLQHVKLVNTVVDFDDVEELERAVKNADVIFSAVGTTQKKAKGDEAAYRKVDVDIPVNLARIGLTKGAKTFILVSAIGASLSSSNFNLRLKGEVEQALKALNYESLYILRPSMLLGKRDDFRLGETVGKAVMHSASILFFGPMRKYHPVKARQVARAMICSANEKRPGTHILCYNEMINCEIDKAVA